MVSRQQIEAVWFPGSWQPAISWFPDGRKQRWIDDGTGETHLSNNVSNGGKVIPVCSWNNAR